MRRWTSFAATLATIAIVTGCSSGGSATPVPTAPASAPPASAPAASGSAGPGASASKAASCCLQRPEQDGVTLTFSSFGGV
jgi:hypothetical protein